MAKKSWISVCPTILKSQTNTAAITWESSSSDEELPHNRMKKMSYSHLKKNESPNSFPDECNETSESQRSPLLTLRYTDMTRISPELTPKSVITNRIMQFRYKRKIFGKRKDVKSPDLHYLQSTQDIENLTPPALKNESPLKIEPFESQFCSPVEASVEEFNFGLYYQPPKRRKNYKKGTLSYQLQYLLKCKKSQVKIWHFEVEKNCKFIQQSKDIIRLKFKKGWKEYGVTLLECNLDGTANLETVLVCLGGSQVVDIDFEIGRVYELHMPYQKDYALYKGCRVEYFFNVSKIARMLS